MVTGVLHKLNFVMTPVWTRVRLRQLKSRLIYIYPTQICLRSSEF